MQVPGSLPPPPFYSQGPPPPPPSHYAHIHQPPPASISPAALFHSHAPHQQPPQQFVAARDASTRRVGGTVSLEELEHSLHSAGERDAAASDISAADAAAARLQPQQQQWATASSTAAAEAQGELPPVRPWYADVATRGAAAVVPLVGADASREQQGRRQLSSRSQRREEISESAFPSLAAAVNAPVPKRRQQPAQASPPSSLAGRAALGHGSGAAAAPAATPAQAGDGEASMDAAAMAALEPALPVVHGHPRAMKPHEVDHIRFIQHRSMRLGRAAIEDFYADALEAKRAGARTRQAGRPAAADGGERHGGVGATQQKRMRAPPNAASLASALGAVQQWTPRAPRKVLTVESGAQASAAIGASSTLAAMSADDAVAAAACASPRNGEEGEAEAEAPASSSSLREDARVAVRARIERGYDLLNRIAEVEAEREEEREASATQARQQLAQLLALHPRGESSAGIAAEFLRICAVPKGKKLVARALPLLPPSSGARAVALIARELAAYANADMFSAEEANASLPFWRAIGNVLLYADETRAGARSTTTSAPDGAFALRMLAEALCAFEDGHRSRATLVVALSSAQGARVLRALFARAYALETTSTASSARGTEAATAGKEVEVEARLRATWQQCLGAFGARLERHLGDAFDLAGAAAAHEMWEILALLDALLPSEAQSGLRKALRVLMAQNRVPQPGQAGSSEAR